MKTAFVLAALACVVVLASAITLEEVPARSIANGGNFEDHEVKELFSLFMRKFPHNIPHEEMPQRLQNFRDTLTRVAAKNANPDDTAEYGITRFSDWTVQEFQDKMLIKNYPKPDYNNPNTVPRELGDSSSAPSSFDWRQQSPSVVTPVKNQEQCGSCWTFSATETLESQWAIAGNSLVELAPQQIVDCDTGGQGCNGGLPSQAFQYIKSAGGLELESDYPYTGADGSCRFDSKDIAAECNGWQFATKTKDEGEMKTALYNWGPLSIAVDATTWQDYTGGVLKGAGCGTQLDHGVGIVGYGSHSGTDIWIVRNSWAASWGIQGYIYVERGVNACGIAEDVTCATVPGESAGGSSGSSTGALNGGGSSSGGSTGGNSGGSSGGKNSGGYNSGGYNSGGYSTF